MARPHPPQRRQQTLDAVKRLLLRESEIQPLIVIFEDLHWIDGETQTLVASTGGAEDAEGYYREGLALAGELGMRPLVAHCHLGLGKLSRRTGKREQAQEHLHTATTMYREMDMRFWVEQAEAETAVLR